MICPLVPGKKQLHFPAAEKISAVAEALKIHPLPGASLWLVPDIKCIKLTSCKLALASDYEGIPASMERNQGLPLTDFNYDYI